MKSLPLLIVCLIAGCKSDNSDRDRPAAAKAVEKPQHEVHDTRLTSKDGTRIGFTRTGTGPALVIVSGALSDRTIGGYEPLVIELAKRFAVYTYDRRGRGQSTNVQPYAVDREIEDLEAVIDHAGSPAYVYGVSSGAALALQAAAKLGAAKVKRLALYEAPYGQPQATYDEQRRRIDELVRTGAPGDAAEYFLTAIGLPPAALDTMKRSPTWDAIKRIDFTLAYDFAVLGDGAIPRDTARAVAAPALVMNGGNSMPFMRPTADEIAKAMPDAERKTLAGQTHQADPKVVAPVLIEFFTRR